MNACKKAAAGLVAGVLLVAQLLGIVIAAGLMHPGLAAAENHGSRGDDHDYRGDDDDDDGDGRHQRKYSDWGPVVNLGCGTVNSASDDQGPAVSKKGLSLYFGSNRAAPDAFGGFDLYVAQRASKHEAWGEPRNLGPVVNSTGIDNIPSFTRDGHWMFFNSDRAGGVGGVDMWVSYRAHVHDDFAWEMPFNLGPGVNTAGFDAGAIYFENKNGGRPLLFFGSGPAQATSDIWVAELQRDGTFGNKELVEELSTPQADQRPSVRFDGLEVIFFSNRTGSTPGPTGVPSSDLWVATRESVHESWGTPANLGPVVNTPSNEITPYISPDGETLFFASNRGECGGNDLYMTTRTKLKRKD